MNKVECRLENSTLLYFGLLSPLYLLKQVPCHFKTCRGTHFSISKYNIAISTRCHSTRWELPFCVGVGKKINLGTPRDGRFVWTTLEALEPSGNNVGEQCWGGGHRGHPVWMAQEKEDAEASQPRTPAALPEKQNKQARGWRKM